MNDAIRIVLADDHTLVRQSLARLLNDTSNMTVVGEVATADEAIDTCIRTNPDIVVLDIDMPGIAAFDAARTIHARCPSAKILFLSAFTHDRYIEAALSCDAMGYLCKTEPPEKVVKAIRTVALGQTYFSPEVQERLVVEADGVHLSGQEVKSRASSLTNRELEVLRYIAKGLSKKEIAKIMHLSVKTVENHAASVMNRLDIHDRVALTRFAIREGLIEP
ncbi:MAG: response regulator transcription factor [Phycisphaeraceae bacterium]|nr:response regulator transcription factor [Phycisphaeraceae bacterium]MBX3408656.1 response regulator transcription factor [Phycisphaeraceae bacterium]